MLRLGLSLSLGLGLGLCSAPFPTDPPFKNSSPFSGVLTVLPCSFPSDGAFPALSYLG